MSASQSSSSAAFYDELWGEPTPQSTAGATNGEAGFALARRITFATPELAIATLQGDPIGVVRQNIWAWRVELKVSRIGAKNQLQERFNIRQRSASQAKLYDMFEAGKETPLGSLERERMGMLQEAPWKISDAQGNPCGSLRYVEGHPELVGPSGEVCVRGRFSGLSKALILKFSPTPNSGVPGPLLLGVSILAMAHQHGIVS